MTQQQQDRIAKAFAAYTAASTAKAAAEAKDLVAGQAMDKAKEYARSGVEADVQALRNKANADAVAAVNSFNQAFQEACDATAVWGAALQEFQAATADSMTTPGAVENMGGTGHIG